MAFADQSSSSLTAQRGWRGRLPPCGTVSQRCTVHKHRNLLAHAPERLHDDVTADYTDMIYAATPEESSNAARPSSASGGCAIALSPTASRKPATRLFTFTRLPPSQWRSARTTNAIERLHEEFQAAD